MRISSRTAVPSRSASGRPGARGQGHAGHRGDSSGGPLGAGRGEHGGAAERSHEAASGTSGDWAQGGQDGSGRQRNAASGSGDGATGTPAGSGGHDGARQAAGSGDGGQAPEGTSSSHDGGSHLALPAPPTVNRPVPVGQPLRSVPRVIPPRLKRSKRRQPPKRSPAAASRTHASAVEHGEVRLDQRFPSPSLGPPLLSASPSPPPFCGVPPAGGGALSVGIGAGAGFVLGAGGAETVGWTAAAGAVGSGIAGALGTCAGARTVKRVTAVGAPVPGESASRRWRPGARSWNVSCAPPERVSRRSST